MIKLFRTSLEGVLIIVISWIFYFLPRAASEPNPVDQISISGKQVLEATVLIKMVLPVSDGAGKDVEVLASGMGTLVAIDEHNYLITHNHWGTVLQEWTKVEFYDSSNHLLKLMLGYEFIGLIHYQDEGTLILKSPGELAARLTPTTPGSPERVLPGEIVQIAYRQGPDRQKAGVLDARVEEVSEQGGVPAYRLVSLSGLPIQKGDSGGGIWQNGKFIGNMWIAIVAAPGVDGLSNSELQPTDISYAASYPAHWSFRQNSKPVPGSLPVPELERETTVPTGIE